MKTIAYLSLFILFLTLGFSACDEDNGQKAPLSKRMELDSTSRYSDQNYKVYTLEGCDYVVVGQGKYRWGSHKGNCKNPIHYNPGVCETGIDTVEKHFDCYVEDSKFDKQLGQYSVTTECGIQFYDKIGHKKDEVLNNFKSPKHK
jgi:hypothetical protein